MLPFKFELITLITLKLVTILSLYLNSQLILKGNWMLIDYWLCVFRKYLIFINWKASLLIFKSFSWLMKFKSELGSGWERESALGFDTKKERK